MKAYIKEHLKIILAITIILIGSVVFIATRELTAKTSAELPAVSGLKLIAYDISEDVYLYTGEPIEPGMNRLVLEDAEGNRIVVYDDAFSIEEYVDNVECGYADIKLSVDAYEGTIVIDDAFQIKPQQVQGLAITQASRESIQLTWNELAGVDGYLLYKSKNKGATYTPIKEVKAGEELTYTDLEVELNATYLYQVKAYVTLDNEILYGDASEQVKQYTPLKTAVIKKVSNVSYNSIKVQWDAVPGAAGYQVYRSESKDGKYTCIKELTDGKTTSYTDATCKLGVSYYYYVKACQKMDNVKVYGDASEILSSKTIPNKASLSGTTSDKDTKVTLRWNKAKGAKGYEVYKSDNASKYKLVKTIESADTLTWNETGLNKDSVFFYKVRSYAVVNGKKIYGNYSGVYEKEITIEYEEVSGEISALTQYVGRPYKFGGTSSTKGWDCSAFVQYVYKKHFGISLPRTASQQATGGKKVSVSNRSAWQPGDLIFFRLDGSYIGHVGIYLGNGKMIHALNEEKDTLIQNVTEYDRWDKRNTLASVRRYLK